MSYEPPTPPETLPSGLVETLEVQSLETLRDTARYAEALAEFRERAERLGHDEDVSTNTTPQESDVDDGDAALTGADVPDDQPSDVPSKATLTIKEINDNRYYYWQWREGDSIKSQYEGPVDHDE